MFSKISAISMTLLVAAHADQEVNFTGHEQRECGTGAKAKFPLKPGCFKISSGYGTNMCNATGIYSSEFRSSDCSGTPVENAHVPFGQCIKFREDGFNTATLDSCVNNAV